MLQNRASGQPFAFDASCTATGRAITRNWIGLALGLIKYKWIDDKPLNIDQIRTTLKKTFQPQFHCNL